MTGLPPREARLLTLAEVAAWVAQLHAEAAQGRLELARQAARGRRR